ncbi:hypothetical protein [Mesorhizobium sp. 1B3]|uniref:hypothetical protein n=1 Tax=Mesorhizobium sp. 1B3 TaxID=3243599 RepID=UPI003D961285
MNDGVSSELSDQTPRGFFAARWHGNIPLSRLFWWDMVVVGTAINIATTVAALVVLAMKGSAAAALAVHLAALPYNFFLFLAVWRTAEKATPSSAWLPQLGAAAWLLLAIAI